MQKHQQPGYSLRNPPPARWEHPYTSHGFFDEAMKKRLMLICWVTIQFYKHVFQSLGELLAANDFQCLPSSQHKYWNCKNSEKLNDLESNESQRGVEPPRASKERSQRQVSLAVRSLSYPKLLSAFANFTLFSLRSKVHLCKTGTIIPDFRER